MASATASSPAETTVLVTDGAWKGLAGFFVSGLLFSFLGAVLPAWRHHLTGDYVAAGNCFLSMNFGIAVALLGARALAGKRLDRQLAAACVLASTVFIYLALVPPGLSPWWHICGIFCLGIAAGLLNTAVFQAISPLYRHDRGATINIGGAVFGGGCIAITALIAGTFYAYSVTTILTVVALLPAAFAWVYFWTPIPAASPPAEPAFKRLVSDLKSAQAVMFALLLFFQFGNEWSVAGWLPLYLVQRLGISPASALAMLCVYWLALVAGRFVVFFVLPSVSRSKMLGGCVLAALFGCIILMATDNAFGAVVGILLVGGGFASIYPLVAEKIRGRFAQYHPGFYNGIFSFALTGGLLAPWSLGLLADQFGIRIVMALPFLGTLMVFVLLVLIWAETKFRENTNRAA